jgi:hypothetical protein
MGERIGRIGRIDTDFSLVRVLEIRAKIKKKSVSIRPIRPIRSPIVSQIAINQCFKRKESKTYGL